MRELQSPNFQSGRGGREPVAIVVHTTDGSFALAVAWMTAPASGVSAHYLVGLDGAVVRLVDEGDAARHAGVLVDPVAPSIAGLGHDPNLTTVGIEFVDDGDPGGIERTDAQYGSGSDLLRAISRRWGVPLDREHVIAHRELRADKTCPGNLDIDRLITEAKNPGIVCLLPVRNEERNLPDWLGAAPAFCDAVVALDDGSTDASAALLEADPLVRVVLRAPVRQSYEGWDDAANRRRLLDAAGELRPRWIIQVDADERIEHDDAQALRTFLEEEAIEGCAYGLRHHRVWGGSVDPEHAWVYRVFRWRPGLVFPSDRRLHFNPVPVSIPRAAWIRTSIRLRHMGAADDAGVEARRVKYEQADPKSEFEANTSGMHAAPERDLVRWEPRDPTMPVLVSVAEQAGPRTDGPELLVLLPVRNGAAHLQGFFGSVRGFADGVIALDDGSNDDTRRMLDAEPLVRAVLSNPVRGSWAGWNEPGDRQRLLDAAGELEPRFVLFLDADERIDEADGAALRGFVERDASGGYAYGLRVHRILREDPPGFDRSGLWVYRLFGWAPDQRLPTRALHFVPVPVSIPRAHYVQTTLRIQHVAGITADERRARFDKYAELDPVMRWQPSYEHLLEEPGEIIDWAPRPEGLPVVLEEDFDPTAPVLSAIVIARDDGPRIAQALSAVVGQETDEPFEVIAVVSGSPSTAAVVRDGFPSVTLVELERPVFPGTARNAGLRVARGDYVSFPGSHVVLAPGSLQARIRAHQRGYPMVTGAMKNGTPTRSGWANYFLDHSTVMPGRAPGELKAPPAHCSYDRDLLIAAGGFPESLRAGEDTYVNNRMFAAGAKAYRSPDIVLTHLTACSDPVTLLVHHFERGRALGRLFFDPRYALPVHRRHTGRMLASLPVRRLRSLQRALMGWGSAEERREFRRSRWLVLAAAMSSWFGTLMETAVLVVRRKSLGPASDSDLEHGDR